LLLNTTIYELEKNQRTLTQVSAFNAINETFYTVTADQFCDATGMAYWAFWPGQNTAKALKRLTSWGKKWRLATTSVTSSGTRSISTPNRRTAR
jgi:hypothetical protein